MRECRNLTDFIFDHSTSRPRAPALVEGNEEINFATLADLVGRAAVFTHDLGIGPGDVVALALPTSIDQIILTLALLRIGAVPFNVSSIPNSADSADPISHFRIARAFLPPAVPGYDTAIVHRVGPDWRSSLASKAGDRRVARDSDLMNLLTIASDANGMPKAIATSHAQWIARMQSALHLLPSVLAPKQPTTFLLHSDLDFSQRFLFLVSQLCVGAPVVLMTNDRDPRLVAERIKGLESGVLVATPQFLRRALLAPKAQQPLFPKLRALLVSTPPLILADRRAIAEQLTPNYIEVYGNPATGLISVLAPEDRPDDGKFNSRPTPSLTVECVDGADRPLPAGRIGHLRCRGAVVSSGWFGESRGISGAEFRGEWYYPGDIGTIDATGAIRLNGLTSDVIRRRGVDIFLPTVERAVRAHQSVLDAAAVGIPSPDGGDMRLVVFVIPNGEPQPQLLGPYCRSNIPPDLFPDRMVFTRDLPKTPDGSFNRRSLAAMANRALEARRAPNATVPSEWPERRHD